jgi:hypothetical protein
MQIWSLPFAWKPSLSLVEGQATMRQISGGKVRLEVTGRKGVYAVELDIEEVERVVALIREPFGEAITAQCEAGA